MKRLQQRIDINGLEDGKPIRGHTLWTDEKVELVEELVFSQQNTPKTLISATAFTDFCLHRFF